MSSTTSASTSTSSAISSSSHNGSDPMSNTSTTESWSRKAQDCWKSFVAWREDIGDDQLGCTCRIPDQCRCEISKVNVAGPL